MLQPRALLFSLFRVQLSPLSSILPVSSLPSLLSLPHVFSQCKAPPQMSQFLKTTLRIEACWGSYERGCTAVSFAEFLSAPVTRKDVRQMIQVSYLIDVALRWQMSYLVRCLLVKWLWYNLSKLITNVSPHIVIFVSRRLQAIFLQPIIAAFTS